LRRGPYVGQVTHCGRCPPELHSRGRAPGAAYFGHQHHIVWDIIARNTILPVAYLAVISAALAVRDRTRPAHPEGQLLVTSFIVGGILCILAGLTFPAAAEYWCQTGWPVRSKASRP